MNRTEQIYKFYTNDTKLIYEYEHDSLHSKYYTRYKSHKLDIPLELGGNKTDATPYIDVFCRNCLPGDILEDPISISFNRGSVDGSDDLKIRWRALKFAFDVCIKADKVIIIEEEDYNLIISVDAQYHEELNHLLVIDVLTN